MVLTLFKPSFGQRMVIRYFAYIWRISFFSVLWFACAFPPDDPSRSYRSDYPRAWMVCQFRHALARAERKPATSPGLEPGSELELMYSPHSILFMMANS